MMDEDRIEEIRQLEAEIKEINDTCWLDWKGLFDTWPNCSKSSIISEIRAFRTVSRLERELAELQKGMA